MTIIRSQNQLSNDNLSTVLPLSTFISYFIYFRINSFGTGFVNSKSFSLFINSAPINLKRIFQKLCLVTTLSVLIFSSLILQVISLYTPVINNSYWIYIFIKIIIVNTFAYLLLISYQRRYDKSKFVDIRDRFLNFIILGILLNMIDLLLIL